MIIMINLFKMIMDYLISLKDGNYLNKHYYNFFLKNI